MTRGIEIEPTSSRLELPYLDGLRGLAALAVVLYHSFLFTGRTGDGYEELPVLGHVLGYGYLGVPIFIVLSGYVLMLPVLGRDDLRLPKGFRSYIGRRARRILPPYYAALLISLALIALIPIMQQPSGTQWDTKVPVTAGGVISHLMVLHDLNSPWIGQINGPLWSIAVEWHIYFLMPLLLLPLWRRLPPLVVAVGALALTTAPTLIGLGRFDYAHPWLVGLFAVGMLAAQATVRTQWALRWLGPATAAAGVATVVYLFLAWDFAHARTWASEIPVGVVTAGCLVIAGRRAIRGGPSRVRRVLQARPIMLLGLASYSIYLLHSPLLGLANLMTLGWGLPVGTQWALLSFVFVPIDLAVCAGFYWLVERRFKNTRQKHAAAELRTT